MSQLRYTKGALYVRRAKRGESPDDFFGAFRMATFEVIRALRGKRPYVAVRRGMPGEIVHVGLTKSSVKRDLSNGQEWRSTKQWFRTAKIDRAKARGGK